MATVRHAAKAVRAQAPKVVPKPQHAVTRQSSLTQSELLKPRPIAKGKLQGGDQPADYILHKPQPLQLDELPSKRPDYKKRNPNVRVDVKSIKHHWDRQSLLHHRKPLPNTDEHKVLLARRFREIGYKQQTAQMIQLLDDLLRADPSDPQYQIDAHVVSSALSAAAKCITVPSPDDPIFLKGQLLMDRALNVKIMEANEFVFSAFFNLCANNMQPDVAFQYYHNMRKKFPLLKIDPFIFASLLKACAKSGDVEKAKKLFERAGQKFTTLDQRLISLAIRFFVGRGQIRYGLKLFNDMVADGLFPSTYDLNVLMTTICKSKLSKSMLKIILDLRKSMEEAGCTSDARTFEALLRGCQRAKALGPAIEIFSEIQSHIRSRHFQAFFDVILATMNNPSVSIDSKRSLSLEDRTSLALDVLMQMEKFELKPSLDILNVILEITIKSNQPLKVVLFLRKMHTFGKCPGASTWMILLK
jgi:pentatricopeptide repeat protein